MDAAVVLLALVGLALAASRWGVDSRPDAASSRPQRWFIELEALDDADRVRRRRRPGATTILEAKLVKPAEPATGTPFGKCR
jgi:hypothetical protein